MSFGDSLRRLECLIQRQLSVVSKNLNDYINVIPNLDFNNKILKNQFNAYLNSESTLDESQNLIQFWKSLENTCPVLSKIAIRSLNIPVTSVDVERSFSLYRDVLSHRRTNLKLSSINTFSMMNYNSNIHNSDDYHDF